MEKNLSEKQKQKLKVLTDVSGSIKTPYEVDVLDDSKTVKQQVCRNCDHWKETLYDFGICSKINEKIEIELVSRWDGGYVNAIETESDFGCNLFKF